MLPGFYKLSIDERQQVLSKRYGLSSTEVSALNTPDMDIDLPTADTMVENCIARHVLPVGLAVNFLIDGVDTVIPMAIEEPSVIAGDCLAAKLCRPLGGFHTAAGCNFCTGQSVFLLPPGYNEDPIQKIIDIQEEILAAANATMPSMLSRDGGAKRVDIRTVETESGRMLIVELQVNVVDSMGANSVTKASEEVKSLISSKFGFEPLMGILTNLSEKRIVSATAKWRTSDLSTDAYDGLSVAQRIVMANDLAKADPARAATHRKGIMNGISAVVEATGNDTRAVEAAVHSYALTISNNPALTTYYIDDEKNLVGEIRLPVPVGTVGGSIKRSQSIPVLKKLMNVQTANDLAKTIAAVGLAQNFAALRALVTAGISEGHMKLHSKNIACEAGATASEIESVAAEMRKRKNVTVTCAREILQQLRCNIT